MLTVSAWVLVYVKVFHHDLDLKQTVPLDLMVFLESIYGNENTIKYVMYNLKC